jgi:hypothetical protein
MRAFIRILAPLALLLTLFVPAGAASAAPATSERTEVFMEAFNNCNGEYIATVEGTQHIVEKVQKDGSTITHVNFNGQGTGTQGNEYVFNLNTKFGPFDSVQRGKLVSKGSEPNQWILIRFKDGRFTFELDCRG